MRVISKRALRVFWQRHPSARAPMTAWHKAVVAATWHTFAEVRQTFRSADLVGNCVVFDVGGNNFRVIGRVLYADAEKALPGVVYVLRVMTHDEYDRDDWPGQYGCHLPPPSRKRPPQPRRPRRNPA